MSEHSSARARFRGFPVWAQVLVWIALWPIPTALCAAARPFAVRRRWWAVTAAVTVVWIGIAASGAAPRSEGTGQEQESTEGRSPALPVTRRASAPDSLESPTADATKESSGPPTTAGRPLASNKTGSSTSVPDAPGSTTSTQPPITTTTRPSTATPLATPSGEGSELLAHLRVAPEGPRAAIAATAFRCGSTRTEIAATPGKKCSSPSR